MADALMDDHVMEAEIDRAIGRDAATDPCVERPMAKADAIPEQRNRRHSEDYSVKIVELERAGARPMMALMQEPARPVHQPTVGHIGEALHEEDGQKEDAKARQYRHECTL